MNYYYYSNEEELNLGEYYKSKLPETTKIEDFTDYLVKKYEIDLVKEFDLFNYLTIEKQEKTQINCQHKYIKINNCPYIKGDFIHKNHKKDCQVCYSFVCFNCNKKFICKQCYNDAIDEQTYHDYTLDWRDKYTILDRYENVKCEHCNREYEKPIWFCDLN